MGAFFLGHIFLKKAFCLLATPKQMPFLAISNETIFFKIQDTRLGAIVAPNKCTVFFNRDRGRFGQKTQYLTLFLLLAIIL